MMLTVAFWPSGLRAQALGAALSVQGIALRTISPTDEDIPEHILLVASNDGITAAQEFWTMSARSFQKIEFLPVNCGVWLTAAATASLDVRQSASRQSAGAAARMLHAVLHDVFKNQYLLQGRAGILRLAQELPTWVTMWRRCGPRRDDVLYACSATIDAVKAHLDGHAQRREAISTFERLAASVARTLEE